MCTLIFLVYVFPKRPKRRIVFNVGGQLEKGFCEAHHRVGHQGSKKFRTAIQFLHSCKLAFFLKGFKGSSQTVKPRDVLFGLAPASYKWNGPKVFKTEFSSGSAFGGSAANVGFGVIRQGGHFLQVGYKLRVGLKSGVGRMTFLSNAFHQLPLVGGKLLLVLLKYLTLNPRTDQLL